MHKGLRRSVWLPFKADRLDGNRSRESWLNVADVDHGTSPRSSGKLRQDCRIGTRPESWLQPAGARSTAQTRFIY